MTGEEGIVEGLTADTVVVDTSTVSHDATTAATRKAASATRSLGSARRTRRRSSNTSKRRPAPPSAGGNGVGDCPLGATVNPSLKNE
ncbi:hypothetical protein ACFQPA_12160 [Halomarina halobia]|uniref:hypothetical protein n=1 Tax=Halomarina halobia TaxID=3033386 RepID=UPI0034A5311D